ncbi:competence damage-inducible protein A [Mobiluncus mulieris]|uniref:CinA family protein n=1 Tax=Mobiluncus mulieris TaxID=2052 RepID=UPI00019F889B|nr:CinA family protein [Mobiluncus mulieris]EEJ54295.1 competence/damage-inducible domain protein CinA [Mobiluncus mulieris ATCC 35243]SPX76128.1 competence damage-inducible protein A [Mobiluncus mulieris]
MNSTTPKPDEPNLGEAMDSPQLVATLLAQLARRGWKLAGAESLTGGMITSTIVDVPGASEVLLGGVVTYTDAIKNQVLGVSETLLETYTAYSGECALAMAAGARKLFGAEIAFAATGVAGPGSDQGFNPGIGFVACVSPSASRIRSLRLPADWERGRIREAFTRAALDLIHEVLATDTGRNPVLGLPR